MAILFFWKGHSNISGPTCSSRNLPLPMVSWNLFPLLLILCRPCDFVIRRIGQKRYRVTLSPSLKDSWQLPGVLSLSVCTCLSLSLSLCHMHTHLWIISPPAFGVFQLRPQDSGTEKEAILVPSPNSWHAKSMIIINGCFTPLSLGVIYFIIK